MANYYGIPTSIGIAAIANAAMLGVKISPTYFVVGDGNGTYYQPTADMTELRHEVWRGPVGICEIDPVDNNVMNFTAFIPSDVGGFTIREMGIIDDKGRLIGVANTPDVQKVQFEEGATTESELIISFVVTHPGVFEWKADPTVIIATKRDIAQHNSNGLSHPEILRQLTDRYSKAEVDAYLSNKANVATRLPAVTDLNLHIVAGSYFWVGDPENLRNRPPVGSVSFALTVKKTGAIGTGVIQTISYYHDAQKWTRTSTEHPTTTWGAWKRLATTEPPQEYDLQLAAGIIPLASPRNKYWLTQFGEVYIEINAGTDDPQDFLSNRTIATLPRGFIPTIDCHRMLTARNYAGTAGHPIILSVSASNGSISVNSFGNSVSVIHTLMSFKL